MCSPWGSDGITVRRFDKEPYRIANLADPVHAKSSESRFKIFLPYVAAENNFRERGENAHGVSVFGN